jgi:hypothetical protein
MIDISLNRWFEFTTSSEATSMKTLHIIDKEKTSQNDKANLLKLLYEKFLLKDPQFHFFYEPEIIIRMSMDDLLKETSNFLIAQNYKIEIYDYPSPSKNDHQYCYGEHPDGIVIKNLDLFLPLFHAHSVAALRLSHEDHFSYMERSIHTLFNPAAYSRVDEGVHLAKLAELKLGLPLIEDKFAYGLDEEKPSARNQFAFPLSHPFAYENMITNRSSVPGMQMHKIEYDCINNGGWMRIRTQKGAHYHVLQATLNHLAPDWKLHFSIIDKDLPVAWNIIGKLFIETGCNMTMKMKVPDYDNRNIWPAHMHGREITVYIYQHEDIYSSLSQNLIVKKDVKSRDFWITFINKAEERLQKAGIKSRGLAHGDKAIGKYCSLRNESFIESEEKREESSSAHDVNGRMFCYPPNSAGYNAAEDEDPLIRKSRCCHFFVNKESRRYQAELQGAAKTELMKLKYK